MNYDNKTSWSVQSPVSANLLDLMGKRAHATPDKPLAISLAREMSYGQAYKLALGLTRYFLDDLELAPGSSLLVYSTNLVTIPSLLVASQAACLRVVLRSPSLLHSDIYQDCAMVAPSLFAVGDDADALAVREAGFEQEIIVLEGGTGVGTSLEDIVGSIGTLDARETPGDLDEPFCSSDFAVAQIVLFTSGSTGKPKGIVHAMSSFIYNAFYLTKRLGLVSADVLYAPIPVFHVYGLVSLFAVLIRGITWVALPRYKAADSLAVIEKAHASVYFCVPTMIIRETREYEERERDLSSIRLCMVAGDTCPYEVLARHEEKFACTVVLSYGMSETAATLTVESPDAPREIRLRGNGPAIEGVTFFVSSESSELLVKTPSIMKGMLSSDEKDVFLDGEGWFHTGDIGYLDEEGRVYVTGRIKDVIIRGGASISPAKVEAACCTCPEIKECAVVGYPDLEYGEKICLFAVPCGRAPLSLKSIRESVRGKVEKGSAPDRLIVVDSIPLLPNGKRDFERLRNLAACPSFTEGPSLGADCR